MRPMMPQATEETCKSRIWRRSSDLTHTEMYIPTICLLATQLYRCISQDSFNHSFSKGYLISASATSSSSKSFVENDLQERGNIADQSSDLLTLDGAGNG